MAVPYDELRQELTRRLIDGKSTPIEGLLVELIGSVQELTQAINDGVRIMTKPMIIIGKDKD